MLAHGKKKTKNFEELTGEFTRGRTPNFEFRIANPNERSSKQAQNNYALFFLWYVYEQNSRFDWCEYPNNSEIKMFSLMTFITFFVWFWFKRMVTTTTTAAHTNIHNRTHANRIIAFRLFLISVGIVATSAICCYLKVWMCICVLWRHTDTHGTAFCVQHQIFGLFFPSFSHSIDICGVGIW